MGNIIVSVVIPCYNSKRTIFNCLKSILLQKVKFEFEVVVVDSSEDDTSNILTKQYPQVKVIRLQQRAFPAKARNIGIKEASGAIIAFIDADCVAYEGWLEKIYQKHQCGYVAVGGAVLNGNPKSILGWAEYLLEFSEFIPLSPLREVRTIPTCNISYKKREVFDRYEFFPSMRTAEDTSFNWMLVENGEKILFDPSIKIAHIHNRNFKSFLTNQNILGVGFAESRMNTKMPGNFVLKYLSPLLFFARLWLITKRVITWDRQLIIKFLQSLPIIIAGLATWYYGLVRTYYSKKHLIKPINNRK